MASRISLDNCFSEQNNNKQNRHNENGLRATYNTQLIVMQLFSAVLQSYSQQIAPRLSLFCSSVQRLLNAETGQTHMQNT